MNKSVPELILELGVIIDQIKACRRGLKEHPNDEIFQKSVPYMIEQGKKLKTEIEKRLQNEKDKH